MLRRLYSTFADGWPGIGLLLLRVVLGGIILWYAVPTLWRDPPVHLLLARALVAVAGLLLIAGLWTPLAGAAVALIVLSELVTTGHPPVGHLFAASIAGALTMLGPGRLSIDARLFGWKRIDLPAVKR